MLRDSLDALVNMDAALAAERLPPRRRGGSDQARRSAWASRSRSADNPRRLRPLMRLLAVSRNLERIADCATNIAEDVIYMVEGRIIRHSEGE